MLVQGEMDVRVAVFAAGAGIRVPVLVNEVAFRQQAWIG
jgi:hypothetical protein